MMPLPYSVYNPRSLFLHPLKSIDSKQYEYWYKIYQIPGPCLPYQKKYKYTKHDQLHGVNFPSFTFPEKIPCRRQQDPEEQKQLKSAAIPVSLSIVPTVI